ncbi:MAG TPA: oxidoreductase [Chthoniobacterales bacterium]
MTVPRIAFPVALIGYGYAGKTIHAPLIDAIPGLRLAVIASRHADKVLADWPAVEVTADAAAAATHPEIELVVIASPNETHAPLAEAALRAGKHVVVDKPFTVTLEQARRLAALATAEQRLLSVFQNRRWDSDFLAAQAVIREGHLGEVLHFESHIDRYRPAVQARWREQAGPGSGVWYDLGPHLADQALQLFGLPAAVTARLVCQRPSAQTEDWAHVMLHYDHLEVILHASMLAAGGVPRFVVHGTAGSWVKHGIDSQEASLKAGQRPGGLTWGEDPVPGCLYEGTTTSPRKIPAPPGDYRRYYAEVQRAVAGDAPNPVPPIQAIAVMAVVETALKAAGDGKTLRLTLTERERNSWH